MSRITINKSTLSLQRRQLQLYKRFLPSLDLKRQQLLIEQKAAQKQLTEAESAMQALEQSLTGLMESLGAFDIDLSGLVKIETATIEEQNIVGARLPVLRDVAFRTAAYSKLAKPIWVDFLVENLKRMCVRRLELKICRERVVRLNQQVRRITQRVNLFEKILIPRAQQNIKLVQIGLGEQERSAVVRSKIAKKKHAMLK